MSINSVVLLMRKTPFNAWTTHSLMRLSSTNLFTTWEFQSPDHVGHIRTDQGGFHVLLTQVDHTAEECKHAYCIRKYCSACLHTGNASAGQEVASQKQGSPVTGSTLDSALLSRLLLCHYASLVRSLDKNPGDSSVPLQTAAQALQLHSPLRSACPGCPLCTMPLWLHHPCAICSQRPCNGLTQPWGLLAVDHTCAVWLKRSDVQQTM